MDSYAAIADILGESGLFAQNIAGFKVRPQQIAMAEMVEKTLQENSVAVLEAGTGTGKTFAYLIPALRLGGKVIISTGTKTLQDQLFQRDLQTVRQTLNLPVQAALLKGRANYICHYHLEVAQSEGRFQQKEDAAYLPKIVRFAALSKTGDKSDILGVPETATIWNAVTSTRDNCLGQECPKYKDCFVMNARKEAMQADIVVVNHHLFFADVLLKDEGAGELLPNCQGVIFDEAHQLPDVASLFFGNAISSGQILELARDSRSEAQQHTKDFKLIPDAAKQLEKACKDTRISLGIENQRLASHQMPRGFLDSLPTLLHSLEQLEKALEKQAERAEGLKNCQQRASEQIHLLSNWINHAQTPSQPTTANLLPESTTTAQSVRWLESFTQGFQLHMTPLDIASIFQRQLAGTAKAWIFASATLSVNGNFQHYCQQLGLQEAYSQSWDSPFNYKKQALLYLPKNMPDPNHPDYTTAVVAAAVPAILASQGHALLLFTSLRAMREAYRLLGAALTAQQIDYPIFLQGEGTRSELLERFRSTNHAILIASQSFWEGIDVKGEQLSLVVIDKLPFAPPDDPVLSARMESMKQAGRNAFMEHTLPEAVISLKQGAGRLIRDEHDRGVLMICDPRLLTKAYGATIWKSLPRMLRTTDADVVTRFFAHIRENQAA